MTLIENILIGLSLSMDAFTIALAEGMIRNKKQLIILSISFGLFQSIMTILGYYLGNKIVIIPTQYQKIISFIILIYIGKKMLKEEEYKINKFSIKSIILYSLITSIDAFSIGITISFYSEKIINISLLIGLITLLISLIGSFLGKIINNQIKANKIGGIILIMYALKILIIR